MSGRGFSMRRHALPLAIFVTLALIPLATQFGLASSWLSLLTRVMIFALAALSLDLVLGVGGLVSFGHAAFLAIGAYATGIMITEGMAESLLILPVVLVSCGLFAAITGAISLRTRGVAFIMITLAFGQMVFYLCQALSRYGGDDGLTLYERSTVAGFDLLGGRVGFFYVVLGVLLGCYLLTRALVASRFGRALRAARENPTRVAMTGFDVSRVRLVAYVVSGMLCGLSGFLLANHTEFVSPAFASWQRSGELIFMAVLGGVGSLHGAIVGAFAFLLAEEMLPHWIGLISPRWSEHWKVLFGPLIIIFVLFARGGIDGLFQRILGRRDD